MGRAEAEIHRGAHWLLKHVYPDGGWGYNASVGSDSDSTAFSILLLVAAGEDVPDSSRELLLSHQTADGGFATYLVSDVDDSWGASHPDVTPIALKALLSEEGRRRPTIDAGVEYVMRARTIEGGWNSFWWGSPLYGTEASISFLTAAGVNWDARPTVKHLLATKTSNAFEGALLASSLLHLYLEETETTASEMVADLITKQLADGSWESPPMLRVTRRECFEPWREEDAGPLFSDPKRLFTSSTVLGALCEANRLLR
jgi:squalene cyclase